MLTETIEARAHTTREGVLNLSLQVGIQDSDVTVTVQVKPLAQVGELDANGWPKGFFERVAGSMPELSRASQGDFERRQSLE
jgi:hypothetical protein